MNSQTQKEKPEKFNIMDCAKFRNAERDIPKIKPKTEKVDSENYITDYMAGISKLGCSITKNRIHDHSKCQGNCKHYYNSKPCKFKLGCWA